MRVRKRAALFALSVSAIIAVAIPALGQERPESILPPGFGDAPEPPARRTEPDAPRPRSTEASRPMPTSSAGQAGVPQVGAALPSLPEGAAGDDEEQQASAPELVDMPPQARRSTAMVGILGATDGDMGPAAFGSVNGRYLTKIMQRVDAPIASRWASILLRRALLSRAQTPAGVSDADWAAERAWLLVRMGEAVSARSLVQAVDVDRYSPALYTYGMQAALASADPAALCPMTQGADRTNRDTSWILARAICSAFSGESSLATAQLDRARGRRGDNDADVLLAEKVVGAAQNTRRAVTINWDDIQRMDIWRYGMATATGLEIPDRLLQRVDPRVRLWRAQAPMLSYQSRLVDAERAAAAGILSSAALVDFYAAAFGEQDPAEQGNALFDHLRDSYASANDEARVDAMSALWGADTLGEWQAYARYLVSARAASRIAPSSDLADEAPLLIRSMLSAGLDKQAIRWLPIVNESGNDLALGLLAVGGPRPLTPLSLNQIQDFGAANDRNEDRRARMLFAGLAGLGRVPLGDMSSLAESLNVPIGKETRWTRALEEAVQLRSPGAVVILASVGLQSARWSDIPPDHLFRIVSALRRVGLEPEARMIAVEAVTRA